MGIRDFTTISICCEIRSQNRFTKISFVAVFATKDFSPSPEFSVGCRVGARSSRARYARVVNPHTSIPRHFSELACGWDGR